MAKSKAGWFVICSPDGKLDSVILYDGVDRAWARAKAEKALEAGAPAVTVYRVTRRVTLTAKALTASLPRTAF